jgi:hypothetical protein
MSDDQPRRDDLPPLKLRPRRRMLPELELPTVRLSPRRRRSEEAASARAPGGPSVPGASEGAAIREKSAEETATDPPRTPLYWRVLRLHHVRPSGWQRAILLEGMVAVGIVLVLAGVATAWTIVVLPAVVAVLVKLNDLVAGGMRNRPGDRDADGGAGDRRGSSPG